jgi:hypothetical protein
MDVNNDMFILALVSIIIIGIICLGLLVTLIIFISKQHGENTVNNNSTTTDNPNQNGMKTDETLQTHDERREPTDITTNLGMSVGIWGIALAMAIYSRNITLTNILQGIAGFGLAIVLFTLGFPETRRFIMQHIRLSRTILIFIVFMAFTLSILSIFFVYPESA